MKKQSEITENIIETLEDCLDFSGQDLQAMTKEQLEKTVKHFQERLRTARRSGKSVEEHNIGTGRCWCGNKHYES